MPDTPPLPIRVPDLGCEDRPIVVGQWLTRPGEPIVAGDRLAELICESVLFYAEAEVGGRLVTVCQPSGCTVECGQVLGEMQPLDDAVDSL